jgi:hypothetical protein
MEKPNCWEVKQCGQERGGINAEKKGVCPVADEISAHGLNDGINGGRICWVVADVSCKQKISCLNTQMEDPCFSCEFRYKVMIEEGLLDICKSTGKFLQLISSTTK